MSRGHTVNIHIYKISCVLTETYNTS